MKFVRYILPGLAFISIVSSCKKFLAVDPPGTDLTNEKIFANDATATAAVLAIYSQMESEALPYNIIQAAGLSSDEMSNHQSLSDYSDMVDNNLSPENAIVTQLWSQLYRYVYQANAVIAGIDKSASIATSTKQLLRGESLFLRAFCHYYLLQFFGDIPYATSTDYDVNARLVRLSSDNVLQNIETDLAEAMVLLDDEYRGGKNQPATERVRPNRAAAAALLARVRLQLQDWNGAITAATTILESDVYKMEPDPAAAFLTGSSEAIWQVMNVVPQYNSYSGSFLILASAPYDLSLQPGLVGSFQSHDLRRSAWIGEYSEGSDTWYFPHKYKVMAGASAVTEYTMMIRLSEIYLIRAEARSRLLHVNDAADDLNVVRQRAGLTPIFPTSGPALLDSILHERRLELFGEFGDRWFYMKRSSHADSIMSAEKGNNWQLTDKLYPIPREEMLRNRNLTQNPGY